jgi:hypothetical protein
MPVEPNAVPSAEDRLDSWKEIAAYLRKGLRTVQRWERTEGLPVRRLGQGSVFAYKSELDAWWRTHSRTLGAEQETAAPPSGSVCGTLPEGGVRTPPPARQQSRSGFRPRRGEIGPPPLPTTGGRARSLSPDGRRIAYRGLRPKPRAYLFEDDWVGFQDPADVGRGAGDARGRLTAARSPSSATRLIIGKSWIAETGGRNAVAEATFCTKLV